MKHQTLCIWPPSHRTISEHQYSLWDGKGPSSALVHFLTRTWSPAITSRSSSFNSVPTYLFLTAPKRKTTCLLHSQIQSEEHRLPELKVLIISPSFGKMRPRESDKVLTQVPPANYRDIINSLVILSKRLILVKLLNFTGRETIHFLQEVKASYLEGGIKSDLSTAKVNVILRESVTPGIFYPTMLSEKIKK